MNLHVHNLFLRPYQKL